MKHEGLFYKDYRDLGNTLHVLCLAMQYGLSKIRSLFGLRHPFARRAEELEELSSKLASDIDDQFCREFPKEAVSPGAAPYPVMPGPYWFECPDWLIKLMSERPAARFDHQQAKVAGERASPQPGQPSGKPSKCPTATDSETTQPCTRLLPPCEVSGLETRPVKR